MRRWSYRRMDWKKFAATKVRDFPEQTWRAATHEAAHFLAAVNFKIGVAFVWLRTKHTDDESRNPDSLGGVAAFEESHLPGHHICTLAGPAADIIEYGLEALRVTSRPIIRLPMKQVGV